MPLVIPFVYHIIRILYKIRSKTTTNPSTTRSKAWLKRRDLACHLLASLNSLALSLYLRNGLLHAYFILILLIVTLLFALATFPFKLVMSKNSYITRVWMVIVIIEETWSVCTYLSVLMWVFKSGGLGLQEARWIEVLWGAWVGMVFVGVLGACMVFEMLRRMMIKAIFKIKASIKEIVYLSLIGLSNTLSVCYMILSVGGEMMILDGILWEIDSFQSALKFFFPILTLAISLPIIFCRQKFICLDLITYLFPMPDSIRQRMIWRL
jgi:hypothetical protein